MHDTSNKGDHGPCPPHRNWPPHILLHSHESHTQHHHPQSHHPPFEVLHSCHCEQGSWKVALLLCHRRLALRGPGSMEVGSLLCHTHVAHLETGSWKHACSSQCATEPQPFLWQISRETYLQIPPPSPYTHSNSTRS